MRTSFPALTALVAGMAVALPSLALPPILDRAPTDAMVTITIPKLSGFEKDVTNLATVMGLPGAGMGLEGLLSMMGIENGVNMDGALCICIFPPKEGATEPNVIVLAPVSSYKDFLGNFGVEPKEGGVDSIMIQGEDQFAKNIGEGYAAFSPTKASIEAFTGKPGSAAAFKTMIGKKADAITDTADLSVIVNAAMARPIVERAIKEQMDRAAEMGMPGGGEAGPEMMKKVFDNSTAFIASFDANSAGLGLDFCIAAKPEGEFGPYLKAEGKANNLLSKLPGGNYLIAAALDTSSSDFKALAKQIMAMLPKDQMGDAADQIEQFKKQIDVVNGQAAVIGFAPGGLSTGLLASTVNYTATNDQAAVIGSTKNMIDAVTKADKGTGMFEAGGAEVAGQKVDVYELKFKADDENPAAAQVMSAMFGGGGLSGYIAKVDGGVLKTFAKNSKLMAEAMKAAKGENSLAKDPAIEQIGGKLPKGRVAELYIHPKAVLDTIKPLAGPFVPQIGQLEIPKNLPPMGLAVSPGDFTLQSSIYLPAALLKFIAETAQTFGNGQGGQENDGGQPAF